MDFLDGWWRVGRWRTRNEAYKERKREKQRKAYKEDLEESRKYEREKKQRQYAANREAINERKREYYRRNKERLRKKIYANRIKRDPSIGLKTAVEKFERGELSFAELDRLYSDRLAILHAGDVCESTRAGNKESSS